MSVPKINDCFLNYGLNMTNLPKYTLSALLIALLALSGCSHKKEEGGSQVAAKVNGKEVSVHQINFAMSRIGTPVKGKEQQAQKEVLKSLVDQEILVQQATEKKLDRNPNVVQAIEASKRQILSQAALEGLVQNLPKPSANDIHDYFVKNPNLFENRKLYKLGEIAVQTAGDSAKQDNVKTILAGTKNLQEFTDKLKEQNIVFKASTTAKSAEELPAELLNKLASMTNGQVIVIPAGGNLGILQLQETQAQPMNEEQSKSAIERFLSNQKRKEAVTAELAKLRAAAKIEYLGTFAGDSVAVTQPASSTANTNSSSTPSEDAKPVAEGKKDDAIAKGLSGLH